MADFKKLERLFSESLEEFLQSESANIRNGTSERNLCQRLSVQFEKRLEQFGFGRYRADVEYNRNFGGRVKTILDDKMHIIQVTCDLIIHSRGTVIEQDNLIAIEMKRENHPAGEKSKDRARLRALTKSRTRNDLNEIRALRAVV